MNLLPKRKGGGVLSERDSQPKKKPFYLFRRPVIYGPILMGALVAWFAPVDVMDQASYLKPLASLVSEVFVPMKHYIEKSNFPQVTELYFLMMVLHAPFHIYFVGSTFEATLEKRRRKALAAPTKSLLADLFGYVVVAPLVLIYLFYWNPGKALGITPIENSRLALGVFGWLYAAGLGCMLLGALSHSVIERLTGKLK